MPLDTETIERLDAINVEIRDRVETMQAMKADLDAKREERRLIVEDIARDLSGGQVLVYKRMAFTREDDGEVPGLRALDVVRIP